MNLIGKQLIVDTGVQSVMLRHNALRPRWVGPGMFATLNDRVYERKYKCGRFRLWRAEYGFRCTIEPDYVCWVATDEDNVIVAVYEYGDNIWPEGWIGEKERPKDFGTFAKWREALCELRAPCVYVIKEVS